MDCPSSCVATCSASKLATWPWPTAWAILATALSACASQSGFLTKAAVGVRWLLSTTQVRSGDIVASAVLLAATTGSQALTRSATATSTRLACSASGLAAIWIWLQVAPPICAMPVASCVITPLPSRCAAMPPPPPPRGGLFGYPPLAFQGGGPAGPPPGGPGAGSPGASHDDASRRGGVR